MNTIDIKRVTLESINTCLQVLNNVEELGGLFSYEQIWDRLHNETSYILIAYDGDVPVGCKLAYNRYDDGSLYSWLGGVIPSHRRRYIATLLLSELQHLAQTDGFTSIRFKSQNRYRDMLHFAIKQNFNIVDFEADDDIEKSVIVFERTIQ
jgi:hypothetical protein